ncbi:MAG: DUF2283 domain-containing protein [bacterium]
MKITYDDEADAYLTAKEVDKTVEVSDRVFVDLDRDGNLRGIEILFVSEVLESADFSNIDLQLPFVGEVNLKLPAVSKG